MLAKGMATADQSLHARPATVQSQQLPSPEADESEPALKTACRTAQLDPGLTAVLPDVDVSLPARQLMPARNSTHSSVEMRHIYDTARDPALPWDGGGPSAIDHKSGKEPTVCLPNRSTDASAENLQGLGPAVAVMSTAGSAQHQAVVLTPTLDGKIGLPPASAAGLPDKVKALRHLEAQLSDLQVLYSYCIKTGMEQCFPSAWSTHAGHCLQDTDPKFVRF